MGGPYLIWVNWYMSVASIHIRFAVGEEVGAGLIRFSAIACVVVEVDVESFKVRFEQSMSCPKVYYRGS